MDDLANVIQDVRYEGELTDPRYRYNTSQYPFSPPLTSQVLFSCLIVY